MKKFFFEDAAQVKFLHLFLLFLLIFRFSNYDKFVFVFFGIKNTGIITALYFFVFFVFLLFFSKTSYFIKSKYYLFLFGGLILLPFISEVIVRLGLTDPYYNFQNFITFFGVSAFALICFHFGFFIANKYGLKISNLYFVLILLSAFSIALVEWRPSIYFYISSISDSYKLVQGRNSGFSSNPNFFATAMVLYYVCFSLTVGNSTLKKVLAILLCVLALILTGSRTAMLTFLSVFFVVSLLRLRSTSLLKLALTKKAIIHFYFISLSAVLLLIALSFYVDEIASYSRATERFFSSIDFLLSGESMQSFTDQDKSASSRLDRFAIYLKLILEKPILGYSTAFHHNSLLGANLIGDEISAQNAFLNIVYDHGVITLLFYFLFFISILRESVLAQSDNVKLKYLATALAIYFIVASFSIDGLYNSASVFFALGLVLGRAFRHAESIKD